jgi:hypothetical protein
VQRYLRLADDAVERCTLYLFRVYKTVLEEHPDKAVEILPIIDKAHEVREDILNWHRTHDGGTERGLVKPGDLEEILEEAEPLPVPDYSYYRGPR